MRNKLTVSASAQEAVRYRVGLVLMFRLIGTEEMGIQSDSNWLFFGL